MSCPGTPPDGKNRSESGSTHAVLAILPHVLEEEIAESNSLYSGVDCLCTGGAHRRFVFLVGTWPGQWNFPQREPGGLCLRFEQFSPNAVHGDAIEIAVYVVSRPTISYSFDCRKTCSVQALSLPRPRYKYFFPQASFLIHSRSLIVTKASAGSRQPRARRHESEFPVDARTAYPKILPSAARNSGRIRTTRLSSFLE